MENLVQLSSNPTEIDHQHAKLTCAPLISSLFIFDLLHKVVSMANRFVEISLLLFFSIFPFFAHKSLVRPHWNDKRLCIHQASGLHFNGIFQFSLRRRRCASNHHPKPIAGAAEKGTRLVERHKSGKSYCFRLISEVSISLCRWWLLVCCFLREFIWIWKIFKKISCLSVILKLV